MSPYLGYNLPLSQRRGIYVPSHGVFWKKTSFRKLARVVTLGDTITVLVAGNQDTAVHGERWRKRLAR